MKELIIAGVVLIVLYLIITAITASKKRPEDRNALETIFASWMVVGRRNAEQVAAASRTATISKEEGLQRCKDEMKALDDAYAENKVKLSSSLQEKKTNLDKVLRNAPGKHTTKAQKFKKQAEKAEEEGKAELAAIHKGNALKQLQMREKAKARLKKTEDDIIKLECHIEVLRAQYDDRKARIEDLRSDFMSMTEEISLAVFNQGISGIQSIMEETERLVTEQNVRTEVRNEISGVEFEEDAVLVSDDLQSEFDKL